MMSGETEREKWILVTTSSKFLPKIQAAQNRGGPPEENRNCGTDDAEIVGERKKNYKCYVYNIFTINLK